MTTREDELLNQVINHRAPPRGYTADDVLIIARVLRDTRESIGEATAEYQEAMRKLGEVGVPWAVDGKALTLVDRIGWLAAQRPAQVHVRHFSKDDQLTVAELEAVQTLASAQARIADLEQQLIDQIAQVNKIKKQVADILDNIK